MIWNLRWSDKKADNDALKQGFGTSNDYCPVQCYGRITAKAAVLFSCMWFCMEMLNGVHFNSARMSASEYRHWQLMFIIVVCKSSWIESRLSGLHRRARNWHVNCQHSSLIFITGNRSWSRNAIKYGSSLFPVFDYVANSQHARGVANGET